MRKIPGRKNSIYPAPAHMEEDRNSGGAVETFFLPVPSPFPSFYTPPATFWADFSLSLHCSLYI